MRWLVSAALLAGSGMSQAQTAAPVPACPPVQDTQGDLVANTNCAPGAPTAPAGQRFPYPGEAPAPVAPAPRPSTAPQTGLPSNAAPSAPQTQAPAGQRFPYPGETDTPGAAGPSSPATVPAPAHGSTVGPPLQDAGSSGESSSSSSSSASEDDPVGKTDDADANDPAAIPRSKRHKLPPVPRQSPSEREQEDVQVAGFYFIDGNFRGSYDRARDAVLLDGDDAAAQLALGNSARKLGKLDEAERAYKRCLELDPVPKVRKPAEKALREMTGGD